MMFTEMFTNLQAGEFCSRGAWSDRYLGLLPSMKNIWDIDVSEGTPFTVNYAPTESDLLADDWGIYSENQSSE